VTGVDESVVTIGSGNLGLHGVLHAPGEPVGGLVLCHPFAEEKKCAHRTLVDLARGCVDAGWAALRFDMRGCGDSPGDFGEADLSDWRADISAATEMLASELERPVGLAGLRLGATLAAQVAGERPFELEMSVDETATPTSPVEHYFVASELRRLGVEWVSLAPRFVGEFAIGTNKGITRATGNTLFDEKINGSFHMALGAGIPESGSVNESSIHWDMVCNLKDGGRIWVDDELFYENGEFLIDL